MTAQEQKMIDELVERVRSTPVADKDVEADRHLQQTLGTVPDALYVLTQTVLVQQYGLTQAKAQIEALGNQLEQLQREQAAAPSGPKSGSFLSRILGADDSSPSHVPASTPAYGSPTQGAASGYQTVNYVPAPPGYPAAPPYGGPAYGASPYGPGAGSPGIFGGGGGGGGFMRGALQTAAGVAAGEMVFQGMEDLFRGFGGHEGRGLAGESVVNNYYGDEDRGRGDRNDAAGRDDSSFYNPAQDASRGDNATETRGFADMDSGSSSDDLSDNAADDNSSFDDSGDSDSSDGSNSDGGDDSNY